MSRSKHIGIWVLLLVLFVVWVVPSAGARGHVRWVSHARVMHGRDRERALVVFARKQAADAVVRASRRGPVGSTASATPPRSSSSGSGVDVGIADLPDCTDAAAYQWYAGAIGADWVRMIDTPYFSVPASCAQTANENGFRFMLTVQWCNNWNDSQIVAAVTADIEQADPSRLWAVGIGNEQRLAQPFCGDAGESAQDYSRTWKLLEPIVARLAPQAVRVTGELAPWDLPWFEAALSDGLPGAQALGAHPYDVSGAAPPQQFADAARSAGLPLWDDEGLSAPDSPFAVNWGGGWTRSAGSLVGAREVATWLARG